MKHTIYLLILVIPLFAACQTASEARPVDEERVEMRSYEVPHGLAQPAVSALQSVFWRGDEIPAYGKASIAPTGDLLVVAPPSVQQGVEALLERMKAGGAPPPQATIQTELWMVAGEPNETSDGPPTPREIQSTLDALVENDGPMRFQLIEHLRVRSAEGEDGEVEGAVRLEQRASVRGRQILSQIVVRGGRGIAANLTTQITLAPDQMVVLGSAGTSAIDLGRHVPSIEIPESPEGDTRMMMYYIIRASVERPGESG